MPYGRVGLGGGMASDAGAAQHPSWIPTAALLGLASVVLASLLLVSGCTSHVLLPREQMKEDTVLERSRVFLRGGREFRFERVTFTPDSLVGHYRVSHESGSEREGIRFVEVFRSYPVALAEVDSVLMVERSLRKGVLYGVGAGAVAGMIYVLLSGDDGGDSKGGGGKPDLPLPVR